jgi:flagellar motor switch protein FliN/FliY
MTNFNELLEKETVSVIEGLTGQTPVLKLEEEHLVDETTDIEPPLAFIELSATKGKLAIVLNVSLATALSDLMLGGEGEEQEELSEDDLDATKEIISNIFGALSTTLSSDDNVPNLSFAITDASYDKDKHITFESYNKFFVYEFQIANTLAQMSFAVDSEFISNFDKDKQSDENGSGGDSTKTNNSTLSDEELKNISLIMDVELPLRVRVGTKMMILKDVLTMDIGSIIELDQLANDPLEILVGNKIVARGEVVIVDGNFGVKIVDIGTPKERLEQLK